MIRRLALLNFKCLESLDLVCAPLTVLCGVNGAGKSSVIQSLLVLRQSFQAGELNRGRLILGGDLADLGTGQDVMFEQAEEERVAFELQSTEVAEPCRLSFEYSRTADELRSDQGAFGAASRVSEDGVLCRPWAGISFMSPQNALVPENSMASRRYARAKVISARVVSTRSTSFSLGNARLFLATTHGVEAPPAYDWRMSLSTGYSRLRLARIFR